MGLRERPFPEFITRTLEKIKLRLLDIAAFTVLKAVVTVPVFQRARMSNTK